MKIRNYFENSEFDELILCNEIGNTVKLENVNGRRALTIESDYKHMIFDEQLIDLKIDELIEEKCPQTVGLKREIDINEILQS